MTKTDLTLSISLVTLLLVYLIIYSSSIINLIPGTLYSKATTPNTRDTNLVYQDPKPLDVLERISNTFNIPVRTLLLVIVTVTSITLGLFIYTSTANIALTSVATIGVFLIAKIFLGV